MRGLAADHNRRVDLLNQHIGFAVRERATLQQLGRVLFRNDPLPNEDPALTRIRNNPELRQMYEKIMAAQYEEQVESLAQADMNPEAGNQVFSIIMAKHIYFSAPPSSKPQLRMQLPNVVLKRSVEIVDLCSDTDDEDGDSGPCDQGEPPSPPIVCLDSDDDDGDGDAGPRSQAEGNESPASPSSGNTVGAQKLLPPSPTIMCSDIEAGDATPASPGSGKTVCAKRRLSPSPTLCSDNDDYKDDATAGTLDQQDGDGAKRKRTV